MGRKEGGDATNREVTLCIRRAKAGRKSIEMLFSAGKQLSEIQKGLGPGEYSKRLWKNQLVVSALLSACRVRLRLAR